MATYTDQFVVYESGAIKKIAVGDTLQVTSNFSIEDGAYDLDIKSHDGTNGLKLNGTLVSASAAELNVLDGATSTNNIASKAVLLDGSGDLGLANNLTVSGNLTVNGTTTTIATTNTTVSDNLLELNSGASSNANDSGIIIERGSTGDNAIIAWDESADGFVVGTTTATASATGDLTITAGPLAVGSLSIAGNTLDADIATLAVPANTTISSFGATLVDDADAATARGTLGLVIGTNVQAWDTQLDDIAALAVTDGNIIVGNGSNWVAESGNTARTSLGLGTGDSPTFTSLTLSAQSASLSLNSQKITDLATPTANADAATKAYVDTATANIATSSLTIDAAEALNRTGMIMSVNSSGDAMIVEPSDGIPPIGVLTNAASGTALSIGDEATIQTAHGNIVSVTTDSASINPGTEVYLVAGGLVSSTSPGSGRVYKLGITTSASSADPDNGSYYLVNIVWMPQFIVDLG